MDIVQKIEKLYERRIKQEETQTRRFIFRSIKIYYIIGSFIALLILCIFFLTPYIKKAPVDVQNSTMGTVLDFGNNTYMQLLEWVYNPQDQTMEIMLELNNSALAAEPNLLIDLYDHNGSPIGLNVAYDSASLIVVQAPEVSSSAYYRLNISMTQNDLLGNETIDRTQVLYQITDSMETTDNPITTQSEDYFFTQRDMQKVKIYKEQISEIDHEITVREDAIDKLNDNIESYQSQMENAAESEKEENQTKIEQAMKEIDDLNQKIAEYKTEKSDLETQMQEYQPSKN